jgi:hypothetical protein
MRTVPAIVFAFIFLAPAVHAQELNPDDFNSVKARRAIREYLDRGEKATKEFLKGKEAATDELVEELEKVLKQETSDGNLQEAIKLRQTIDELKKNARSNTAPSVSQLVGRWKIRYSAATAPVFYDIVRDGDQIRVKRWEEPDKSLKGDTKFFIKDGEIWWTFNNGSRRDRAHLLPDGRLMIEHWYMGKSKSTDRFPDQFAIGEKVE